MNVHESILQHPMHSTRIKVDRETDDRIHVTFFCWFYSGCRFTRDRR